MDKQTKKYITIGAILGVGIVGFVGFKKIRAQQQQKAAAKAITKGNVKDLGINIPEIAKQIGIDLGTAYGSLDPRSWTENDTAVKILVLKVPKPYIQQLAKSYASMPDTRGRDLQSDLQKKLDDYNEVSYLFK